MLIIVIAVKFLINLERKHLSANFGNTTRSRAPETKFSVRLGFRALDVVGESNIIWLLDTEELVKIK